MEEDDSKAPSSAGNESTDHDSSESDTELMVTSRLRRTTAGNRYNNVVAQEQAAEDEEDDVALLFAEMEGEDEEYHSDEGADDADMSSSDDDDQGPNAAADDIEGEKEIQREAKVERAKKRKADLALTSMSGLRKKPKIDPTALRRAPAPKPSKRKERVSWLPDQGFAPGRTSLRKQTLEHRAETHAKLKKNEQQRLKAKSIRAQREKEREADAPKELTQADRLVEAERIERRNAKSLNRWEATEKKRQEEQAAKLAALKDRKLEGAVVSMRSTRQVFHGWRNKDNPEGETGEVKKRGRKSKAYLEQLAAAKLLQESSAATAPVLQTESPAQQSALDPTTPETHQQIISPTESGIRQTTSVTLPNEHDTSHNPSEQTSHISEEVSKDRQPTSTSAIETSVSVDILATQDEAVEDKPEKAATMLEVPPEDDSKEQESREEKLEEPQSSNAPVTCAENDQPQDYTVATSDQEPSTLQPHIGVGNEEQMKPAAEDVTMLDVTYAAAGETDEKVTFPLAEPAPQIKPSADPQPPAVESAPAPEVISIRNLVVLESFDSLSSQNRNEYGFFYSTRKTMSKPAKHTPELCLITGLPVRYRDPVTGMGYHNATAFKKIKELREHKFVWSSMLGCYAGSASLVARGVPEGFSG